MAAWSVACQLAVVALIAAFFLVLARSIHLDEVRFWAVAWIADAVATAAVFAAAFLLPGGTLAQKAAVTLFVAAETAFCFFLVAGARTHLRPGAELPLPLRRLVPLFVAWSLCVGLLAPTLALAQVGEAVMVGALMTAGAAWIVRNPRYPRSRWLGWAFLAKGLVALGFTALALPWIWGSQLLAGDPALFPACRTAVELVVALASLVALQSSTSEQLVHLNRELLASQERLRQLVDLDPLTNLINRRGLGGQTEHLRLRGAALIFMDLNGFKKINDRYGHLAGDACLQRIAGLLTSVFRTEDLIFRWGGDEFLVIAPGLGREAAHERVAMLRKAILSSPGDVPMCSVSVGVGMLPPAGDLGAALKEADTRMYEDKEKQRAEGSGPLPRLSGAWSG